MSKCPSSIRRRDSNPRPFEHESSPLTTRPGLPPSPHLFCTSLVFLVLALSISEREREREKVRRYLCVCITTDTGQIQTQFASVGGGACDLTSKPPRCPWWERWNNNLQWQFANETVLDTVYLKISVILYLGVNNLICWNPGLVNRSHIIERLWAVWPEKIAKCL